MSSGVHLGHFGHILLHSRCAQDCPRGVPHASVCASSTDRSRIPCTRGIDVLLQLIHIVWVFLCYQIISQHDELSAHWSPSRFDLASSPLQSRTAATVAAAGSSCKLTVLPPITPRFSYSLLCALSLFWTSLHLESTSTLHMRLKRPIRRL